MRYRPDIDGLRAVAVVPILLFHAGIERISGGFIGVDIFFVISGFLITTIITADLASGQFSMLGFYRRRIVRILPALLAMLAIVMLAAWATMLPGDIRDVGHSAAAAAGFVANVLFYADTDYFAGAAAAKPLLHTWSLGVEEQFYILYPLLLLAVHRWAPGRLRAILAAIALLSLAIAAWAGATDPAAAFYLLPSRAWELALGGLVALGVPRLTQRQREAAAIAGAALILAGLFLIRPRDAFPFPWALLPVAGAALLIAYGAQTLAGRALSLPPVRWLGRISFSLYLWHWPIITFWRLRTGFQISQPETLALIAASLVTAWASYRLIEQPFLARFRDFRPRPAVLTGAGALAAVTATALVGAANAETLRPVAPQVRRIAAYADYRFWPQHQYQYRHGDCFVRRTAAYDYRRCLAFSATKPNMIVVGDSHAAQYWRPLALRFPDYNVMQANAAGCRPTLDQPQPGTCREMVQHILGPLLETRRPEVIVLAGRWEAADLPHLAPTLKRLRAAGVRAVIIGPVVEYDGTVPRLLAEAIDRGDPASFDTLRVRDRGALDERMAAIAAAAGATYVSPHAIECPAGRCRRFAPDGGPMHFDYGHLTLSGAELVIAALPPLARGG